MADEIILTLIAVLLYLSMIIVKSYNRRRSPLSTSFWRLMISIFKNSGNIEPTRRNVSDMMTTSLLIQQELLKQDGYVRVKVAQKPMLDTIWEEYEDEDQNHTISEPKDLATADAKDMEANERKLRGLTKRESRSIEQHITRIRIANIEKKRKFENQSSSNNLKSTSNEPKATGPSARCTKRRQEQAALKHVERIRGMINNNKT